ncbi:MAG: endoribonuclease MazF [Geobacter sp.]|nr:endoribonuclease MazF [Geobacter sp.]
MVAVDASYTPDRGDIVWLTFTPHAGHEQTGRRLALVLSPSAYNRKVGLAIFCPITSQIKGYPFEVAVPQGLPVGGVVLSDQVKSLDWKARKAEFVCKQPDNALTTVLKRLGTLVNL